MRIRSLPALAVAAAALAVAVPAVAAAQPASAYLGGVSQPGDPVGQGRSYSYSTEFGTSFEAFPGADQRSVRIEAHASNGEDWTLRFEAPPGQPFTYGTYPAATLGSGTPGAVGLSVSVDGRGCATVTGSVDVIEVQYGPDGSLSGLIFWFHQFCDGATAELSGEISASIRPDAPPLTVDLRPADTGSVVRSTGVATVSGTTTCDGGGSGPARFALEQRQGTRVVRAETGFTVTCSPTTDRWTAVLDPARGRFTTGAATLRVEAQVQDRSTGAVTPVTVERTVTLRRP